MDAWWLLAACRDYPAELFFPSQQDDLQIAIATSVCYACPVRIKCLEYARERKIEHGIWGGVFLERPSRRRKLTRCSRCGSTHLFRWEGRIECSECSFSWAV